MEQDMIKAKELLSSAEHIGILLPEHPGIDCFIAAEAIWRGIEARGGHAGLLPGAAEDAGAAPASCVRLARSSILAREFVVSIATDQVPVSQLRYEKHDNRIEIILSPKGDPIRQDLFSFREGSVQCDCLIAIGVADIEAVPVREGVGPAFFAETPIIALGNNASQKTYGDANLIYPPEAALSEGAYTLVTSALSAKPDQETATLLYAGILRHTDGFSTPIRRETHAVSAELIALGADQTRARNLAGEGQSFTLTQLTARAAVRSKETGSGNTMLWSFLTAEDFEKTGRTPADAIAVLTSLGRVFPSHRASVLLWQDPLQKRVHAAIAAAQPTLDMIAARGQTIFRSPSLLLAVDFENFVAAEEHVASLLREVL